MRFLRTFACAALSLLVAGCADRGLAPALSSGSPAAQPRANVSIVIKIPKAARKRRSRYISAATKSMTIAFTPVTTGTTLRQTIDLTPTTNGCGATLAGTLCTRTVQLAVGRYTASISTYDGMDAGGSMLSSGQNVAFDVKTGRANHLQMTLSGIPHAITITSTTPGLHGSQATGFTLYGNTTQKVSVLATDADGNPIVGAGAPVFAVAVVSGSGWVAATPAPSTPNTLLLMPPVSNGASATIQVTATYPDATCGATGAVCAASITVLHHLQNVWVLDAGSSTIDEFAYPYTGTTPIVSIADSGGNIGGTNQNPQGFAMDAHGNIFVANCSATCGQVPPDSVTEYAAPGYSLARTITAGIANPEALTLDLSGDLFVANQNGDVTVYPPPYTTTTPLTITTQIEVPVGLALDASANLYVLDCATSCAGSGSDLILKFASPYTGTPVTVGTIGKPAPGAILVDASGNVFAGTAGEVTEYASSSVKTTMNVAGEAIAIALNDGGNLFVAGCSTGCAYGSAPDSLLEFAYPYTGAAKPIDASGSATTFGHPTAVVVDGAGNFIAANGNDNTLRVYAWPYGGAPLISTGALNGPTGLILTP